MTVLKMPLHNLPSRPSQRVDVKDVPGRFVKHVMGLNKSAKGGQSHRGLIQQLRGKPLAQTTI